MAAAGWMLLRRRFLSSAFFQRQRPSASTLKDGLVWNEKPFCGSVRRPPFISRKAGIQTLAAQPNKQDAGADGEVKHSSVVSKLKTSSRHDLAMVFTCNVCETRSVKTACRESYEKGVVVARCDGCNNLHLIADRLGWFGEPGSVEDFLAARGEQVKKGSVDTLNLTPQDLAGHHHI